MENRITIRDDDGRLFSNDLSVGATLNDAEAQAFREVGTKHTLQDPTYKDSITVYLKDDGTVMFDSFQIARSNHRCDHCGAPLPGYEPSTCCSSAEFADATECGCGGPRERICAECEEQRRLYLERMETRKAKR